jgi:carboxypeptidase family protein
MARARPPEKYRLGATAILASGAPCACRIWNPPPPSFSSPPKGWGRIAGTVTRTDCKGNVNPLQGAQVQASGKGFTFSLETGKDGTYAFWAPSASNPYTIIGSKDGYQSQSLKVNIKSNKTTTLDFNLHALGC